MPKQFGQWYTIEMEARGQSHETAAEAVTRAGYPITRQGISGWSLGTLPGPIALDALALAWGMSRGARLDAEDLIASDFRVPRTKREELLREWHAVRKAVRS